MADAPAGKDGPPKPYLTLRVGISGHRPKDSTFPADAEKRVQAQLREVFAAIDRALEDLKSENAEFYAQDDAGKTPHKVRLVSGLAEGADQMAVDARPAGWELDAVLPFPYEYYLPDFETSARDSSKPDARVAAAFEAALGKATTVLELPRDPRLALGEPQDPKESKEYWRLRDQAYARLGQFLLGQIDLLVAVWNGEREDGPGGTAEVVRTALDAGIRVVWISTVEDVQPRIVAEVSTDGRAVASEESDLKGTLTKAIETIISVPKADIDSSVHTRPRIDAKERLRRFFRETWPPTTRAVLYDVFKRWVDRRSKRWRIASDQPADYAKSWDSFLKDSPIPENRQATPLEEKKYRFTARIRDILLPRYAWADALAIEQSHRYRSAYIGCYLLAILLAAIALMGVFTHDFFEESNHDGMLVYKAVLVACELALILLIVYLVWLGTKRRWQERWMEYRALAEMLRSARFLSLLGEHGYIQRSHDLEPASSAWFLWYMRATTRELGLPYAELDSGYQNKVLLAVETHVIDDQLAYNEPTSRSLASMHHRLHTIGNVCFFLAAAVLFAFLAASAVYGLGALCGCDAHWRHALGHALVVVKSGVTFLAAFLPAVGAALYGIRETGDFQGFSERATRTARKLEQLKFAVGPAKRKLRLESTTALLLATARILSEDLGAWQSVYGRKQLNLPA